MRGTSVWVVILAAAIIQLCGCGDDTASPPEEQPGDTIQDMVDAATPGDTVLIAPGIYTDLHEYTDFLGRTFRVACVVKPGVVVRGETGDPADVIIDAQGGGWGFWFYEAGDSTGLAAVTVRNALWGVAGYDASPWIDNCILEDCGRLEDIGWTSGVGMYFDRSSSVVTDCRFRNNQASSGGGATFSSSSDVRLERCIFTGNSAARSGGGLAISGDSHALIIDCTFTGNSAGARGGGVYFYGYSLRVVGGAIMGNSAGEEGGGVAVQSVPQRAILEGVEVSGNAAPAGDQGYAHEYSGGILLVCCTTDAGGWEGDVEIQDVDCGK